MQVSDVFAWPLSKVNWFFTCWVVTVVLTVFPGTLLWAISLGSFRYYNLMGKLCVYLVDQDIAKERVQWK